MALLLGERFPEIRYIPDEPGGGRKRHANSNNKHQQADGSECGAAAGLSDEGDTGGVARRRVRSGNA